MTITARRGNFDAQDQNVNFGSPRHRGAEGGEECGRAFASLIQGDPAGISRS